MSPPELHVTVRLLQQQQIVVAVEGELDAASTPMLVESVLDTVLSTPTVVWLDLRGVTFLDSGGLWALLSLRRTASVLGAALEVRDISDAVRRVIETTGTSSRLGLAQ